MKLLFTIINIFIITVISYLFVDIVYKKLTPENNISKKETSSIVQNLPTKNSTKKTINKDKIKIILTRNLFGVDIEESKQPNQKQKIEDKAPMAIEPTKLNLKLWGTVTGGSDIFAVIEDKKLRKQSLFQVGDSIAGASIKEILRNKIILSYDGTDQILETETNIKNKPSLQVLKPSPSNIEKPSMVIPKQSIVNSGDLASQIKFRPHFTNGQPDGLMIYGIRSNSIFSKIGLRNGDIIKKVNQTPIVLNDDSVVLFSEIEQAENLQLNLLRRGEVITLSFKSN